jgi:DNA-binding response OmpR family regulator
MSREIKVLFIEDDNELRFEVKEFLSLFFEDITDVESAEEGLELYKESLNDLRYDLIISDIRLPKMNGLELIEKVKKLYKEQRIIIISAHEESEYFLKCIDLGVDAFLVKPFDSEKLISSIAKIKKEISESELVEDQRKLIKLSDDTIYNMDEQALYVVNEEIKLAKKEHLLIHILAENIGKIVSYEQISNYVWGEPYVVGSTFRALIMRVRDKVGNEHFIENVKGMGYKLVPFRE